MIRALADEQARLLDIAAALVTPGGRIVYAVCSLVEEEGPDRIDAFLSRHSGWARDDAGTAGRAAGAGRVLTPAHDGCDGFFFAALKADDAAA
jgi:16S rRNA (cytosine967-C5)-methyltransferase